MALKPEISLGMGLTLGVLVYSIYTGAVPRVADVRVAEPNDPDISSSRKLAAWTSAGAVAAVSLIAKDPTVFTVGGVMVIILDWWYRHANVVDPLMSSATYALFGEGDHVNDGMAQVA